MIAGGVFLLRGLSWLYRVGVMARLALYRLGWPPSLRLPCQVVSVGNLTLGGSGKTPVVAYLARFFASQGRRVVILSRGYKGQNSSKASLVSDGRQILLSARQAGDEPVMLARKLPGIPVVIGKRRYQAGLYAWERFKPDLLLLDDGFQHLALFRDLDILLFSEQDLKEKTWLFPAGRWREPLSSAQRAHILLCKGGDKGPARLRALGLPHPAFAFNLEPARLIHLKTEAEERLDLLKGRKVLALAGIARPQEFFQTVQSLGAQVTSLAFADHHYFTDRDYAGMARLFQGNDFLLTTEKDAARMDVEKLTFGEAYALAVEVSLGQREKSFERTLTQHLNLREKGEI